MRVLDKKIKRLMDMRTDSPEMLRALGSLSSFYGSKGNTLEARRSLRADLEQRNIELVKEFIESFSKTAEKLDVLDKTVRRVNETCVEMQKKLEMSEQKTKAFSEITESLRKRRQEKMEREKLMRSFLDQFELSDRQIETLYRTPVYQGGGKEFFEALDVVKKIQNDCQRLLSTQYQKIGQDVLESISTHEKKALGRLFEWTKTRMYASFTSSKPIVDPYLERAVKTLCSFQSYRNLCTLF
jgi:conserved oligomeric Golgi complex subunit 6